MAQNLLLISVDSPVLMGIYEDCKLVKSFSAEGKFSDSLPRLFAEVLDSAESQNLIKKELCEAPENSPASWCKKSGEASSSASADFLLEAEKRGSPPKSEKRQLLARRGSGAGGAALLREKKDKVDDEGSAESSKKSKLDSASRRISNIFYANGPGNFSAIKLTHIFLQTLSIAKNIPLFCADAFHFSNGEFINAYSKVHFYKEGGEIRTKTLSAKQQNHFSLPRVLDMSIFSSKCEPLYILPAV